MPTPGSPKLSNCPPLAFGILLHNIGESQPGVGSWQRRRRFCPPLAQAETTLLSTILYNEPENFQLCLHGIQIPSSSTLPHSEPDNFQLCLQGIQLPSSSTIPHSEPESFQLCPQGIQLPSSFTISPIAHNDQSFSGSL